MSESRNNNPPPFDWSHSENWNSMDQRRFILGLKLLLIFSYCNRENYKSYFFESQETRSIIHPQCGDAKISDITFLRIHGKCICKKTVEKIFLLPWTHQYVFDLKTLCDLYEIYHTTNKYTIDKCVNKFVILVTDAYLSSEIQTIGLEIVVLPDLTGVLNVGLQKFENTKCTYYTFKAHNYTRLKYFKSICNENLDNMKIFFDRLVVCKIESNEDQDLDAFVREEIGEHFNAIDFRQSKAIAIRLLSTKNVDWKNLFDSVREVIDDDFNRRYNSHIESLAWYASDCADKSILFIINSLLLNNMDKLNKFLESSAFLKFLGNLIICKEIDVVKKFISALHKVHHPSKKLDEITVSCFIKGVNFMITEDDDRLNINRSLINYFYIDGCIPVSVLLDILNTSAMTGHHKTFEFYIVNYASGQYEFLKEIIKTEKYLDILKELVQCPCVPRILSNGDTLLHTACREGASFKVIKFLAENEKNINVSNNDGESPLNVAIASNVIDKEVIQWLVSKGAEVKPQKKGGSVLSCVKNFL